MPAAVASAVRAVVNEPSLSEIVGLFCGVNVEQEREKPSKTTSPLMLASPVVVRDPCPSVSVGKSVTFAPRTIVPDSMVIVESAERVREADEHLNEPPLRIVIFPSLSRKLPEDPPSYSPPSRISSAPVRNCCQFPPVWMTLAPPEIVMVTPSWGVKSPMPNTLVSYETTTPSPSTTTSSAGLVPGAVAATDPL